MQSTVNLLNEIKCIVNRSVGVTGPAVPVVRHIVLAIVAMLLAWLSDFLCRKILVPTDSLEDYGQDRCTKLG